MATAYIRVSTDSEDQLHSFEAQRDYWKRKLSSDPRYKFVGIYADEGISGKSAKKRKQFMEMVAEAKRGRINIIFVKSVTRFGRNFVDILSFVRDLRDNYNVVIYFEEEEMYSDDPKADTILAMRAMVAEQELIDMSQQQHWAARKRFLDGKVEMSTTFFGYEIPLDENGRLMRRPENNYLVMKIKEDEAETVRIIYSLYLGGMSPTKIVDELERLGRLTAKGKTKWGHSTVQSILSNEKYAGDAILQKTYTENLVEMRNMDEKKGCERILIQEHHDPIVDRETFDAVQERLRGRSNPKLYGNTITKQPFAGFLKCGDCGASFRHKMYQYRGRALYGFWCCSHKMKRGHGACQNNNLKDSVLIELYIEAFNEFVEVRVQADSIKHLEQEIKRIRDYDAELLCRMHKGYINKISFITEHKKNLNKIAELDREIMDKSQDTIYKVYKKKSKDFDASSVDKFLKEVTVTDWTVTFVFKNGVVITKPYTNGTSGNKVGWKPKYI